MNIRNLFSSAILAFIPITAMAIEEPDYRVIEETTDFEVRHYEPYIVAEVDIEGDMRKAGNSAFKILAGYIFGDNVSSEKMAMTAPVTTSTNDGVSTYGFVMEKKYTLDTLPVPNDDRIRIRKVPERIVAVRRYSGRWTDKKYEANKATLLAALDERGLQPVGQPILARYNSPFSLPFARRNEVMIEIAAGGIALAQRP